MYVDKQEEFSDAQAVTVTAISTNVLDLTQGYGSLTTIDIGTGEDMYLVVNVLAAFTAGGAATMVVELLSDSTENLATSPTTHWTSATIAVATLVAGYEICKIKIPPAPPMYERYLGVRYTVATGPMLTGTVDAILVKDIQSNRAYPGAFTVS